MHSIRVLLSLEALGFATAALVHAGALLQGYEHREAMVAESVIAVVLVLGLVGGAIAPPRRRAVALAVQGFALMGTLVGIVMIAVGIGPQSAFDVVLHTGFVALLIAGLAATARFRLAPRRI